jgi:hypothetical protein
MPDEADKVSAATTPGSAVFNPMIAPTPATVPIVASFARNCIFLPLFRKNDYHENDYQE